MDYVHGRACKMHIFKTKEGYELPDTWYDHTEAQYDELLSRHGISRDGTKTEVCAFEPGIGVPAGCTLNPMLQMAMALKGNEHPCDRCNMDRAKCKGYAKKGPQ